MTPRSMPFRLAGIALAAAATPLFAYQGEKRAYDDQSKEGVYERLHALAQEIEAVRARTGDSTFAERLMAEYEALSRELGGDDPGRLLAGGTAPQGGTPRVAPAPCSGSSPTTTSFSGTTGPIPDTSPPPTLTTVVTTADTYLWDVNLNTTITHTENADLDIRLTSPAGTVVTITTDNGGANDDVFNGTVWDDNVNFPCTDKVYANLTLASPLSPEGRLQAFRGENPNGTWTLTVADDLATDTGTISAWSLDITTLAAAPSLTTTTVSDSPGALIPPGAPGSTSGTTTDTMVVSGLDTYLVKAVLYTEITHTYAGDLDISLTSPGLTTVVVTTDNGGGANDVFNGTTWDPDAPIPATDATYTDLMVTPLVSPEGSFDNFLGQDPNGTWTLTIVDDAGGDVGVLARWDLALTTTTPAPTPSAPANHVGGGTPAAITDPVNPPAVAFTAVVSGTGSYLWDLDLTAAIPHTAAGDLDITLTSPSLTTVTITTDNGGTNDDVFNGTTWDAQSIDATTDYVYSSGVPATPLSAEGSLDAFRGENPNGTWTLTVDDDLVGDVGSVTSWSLGVTTLTSAPADSPLTISQSPALAILDVATVSDSMAVSGLGAQISEVILYTEITHTFAADMDIFLTSPALTTVTITTDNGGGNNDVFNGTSWDPDSTTNPTDYVYANLVVAPLLSPEGSFGAFVGEDPNGSWVLTITDDLGADVGTLNRWDLTISTCGSVPAPYCAPTGPTFDGCTPTVNAPVQPNTAHTSGCTIAFENLPDNRNGIVFYSTNGAQSASWCTPGVGNSMLCVIGPTWRTGLQDTLGGAVACDGELFLDWDAYQVGTPGAQGQPWSAGDKAWVQGWFRSPSDCRTTFLTEAVELTYE